MKYKQTNNKIKQIIKKKQRYDKNSGISAISRMQQIKHNINKKLNNKKKDINISSLKYQKYLFKKLSFRKYIRDDANSQFLFYF